MLWKSRPIFFATDENGYTPVYPEDRKKQGKLTPYYPGKSNKSNLTPYYPGQNKSELTPYYPGQNKSELVPYKIGSTKNLSLLQNAQTTSSTTPNRSIITDDSSIYQKYILQNRLTHSSTNSQQLNGSSFNSRNSFISQNGVPLAHPDWYLGFWGKTYIKLWVKETHGPSQQVEVVFGGANQFGGQPRITIDLNNHVDRFSNYRRHIGSSSPSFGTFPSVSRFGQNSGHQQSISRISLGRFSLLETKEHKERICIKISAGDNSSINNDPIPHVLSDDDGNMEVLIVYYSSQWKGRYSRETTPDGKYYINNNLFDNITLNYYGADELVIKDIKIKLNNVVILNTTKTFPHWGSVILSKHNQSIALDEYIETFRLNSPYQKSDDDYNPIDSILFGNLASHALKEVGKGWNSKYGCPWRNGTDEPKDWCSEFVTWCVNKVYIYNWLPVEESTTKKVSKRYRRHSRFICPSLLGHDGYKFLGGPMFFQQLNQRTYPRAGDFVSLQDSAHSVMFLYWVSLPEAFLPGGTKNHYIADVQNFYDDAYFFNHSLNAPYILTGDRTKMIRNLLIALDGHNDIFMPTAFDSDSFINMFRAVSGNAGDVVKIRNYPIINLEPFTEILRPDLLFGRGQDFRTLLWRLPEDSEDYQDGFGVNGDNY